MSPLLLAVFAAALLAFGALSRRAERGIVTPPLAFAALGLALSDLGVGWLDVAVGDSLVHGLAELTLVIVLFTDASRIDLACLRREGSLPARMLALGLPLTVAAGALAALVVLPELGPGSALVLAAILAPTDAALGQAVVSSRHVPVRIRQSLNVESGLNDGIALPVVLVAASLAGAGEHGGDAAYWVRFAALQLVLGPAVGVAVGYLGRPLERAVRAGWMSHPFQLLSALGLAALAFAGAELVGGNGFIAAFVAGLTLGNVARGICPCLFEFGEAEGQLLTLLVFLIFGGVLLPEAMPHWDASAAVYAALSLTVVRMLPIAMSLLGSGLMPVSLAFLGWFGPRGLASILFALLVVEEGGLARGDEIQAIVLLTVLASTVLHGVTAHPLARRYGERVARARAEAESADAMELPVRVRHFGAS